MGTGMTGIICLVLTATLFVAWSVIVRNKRPDGNIVINIDRRGGAEHYQYNLPNQRLPMILYRRGSYLVQFVSRPENTPSMLCPGITGNHEVSIRGKEEMKLLAAALAHIDRNVDKKV